MNRPVKYFFNGLVLFMSFCSNSFAHQGITSDVHGNHIGEIVWSNEAVSFRTPAESALKNKFSTNDYIYGRIYMDKSINDHTAYPASGGEGSKIRDGSYVIHAYIGEEFVKSSFGVFYDGNLPAKSAGNWTTFQFSPKVNEPDAYEKKIMGTWAKAIRNLAPGEHKIRFEVWGTQGQYKTKKPMSAGGFTLVVAAGGVGSSGLAFPADKYSGSDKTALKQKMRKAIVGPVAKSASEVLDVSIQSDWKSGTYSKPPYLQYRKITGMVLWHDTNNDKLCRYTSYNFIQDKADSGWSTLRFQSFCNGCEEGDAECPK